MHHPRSGSQPTYLNGFSRIAIEMDGRLRIKTTCASCGGQFVGDADDLISWERNHAAACSLSIAS